jgi:hypothetical protein
MTSPRGCVCALAESSSWEGVEGVLLGYEDLLTDLTIAQLGPGPGPPQGPVDEVTSLDLRTLPGYDLEALPTPLLPPPPPTSQSPAWQVRWSGEGGCHDASCLAVWRY